MRCKKLTLCVGEYISMLHRRGLNRSVTLELMTTWLTFPTTFCPISAQQGPDEKIARCTILLKILYVLGILKNLLLNLVRKCPAAVSRTQITQARLTFASSGFFKEP